MKRFVWWVVAAGLALVAWPVVAMAALSVNLAWDYTQNPDAQATGFSLERCVGQNCTAFFQIGGVIPVATLVYSDTAVNYSTWYTYRVKAVNTQGGVSAPSNAVSFQTPAATLAVPSNMRGTVVP